MLIYRTGGISCYHEERICKLIVSSIVLHNFCVKKEIPLTEEDRIFRDNYLIPVYEDNPYDDLTTGQISRLAQETRKQIAQQL